MKVWTIVPKNWEYNDEVHVERGKGLPQSAFVDYKKAEEEVMRLTIKDLEQIELSGYGYGYWEIFNREPHEIEELFKKVGLLKEEETFTNESHYSGFSVPSSLKREQAEALLSVLQIEFYEIVEMEVVE